ncbi:MAG: TraB/GumN family protein [Caulobacter sp.]
MTRRLLSPLAALVLLLTATPAAAEPPVWTVRDADSTIVLFGSVHVLPADLDWRPDALDAALAKADDLWFETPVDAENEAAAGRAAMASGYLPADQSLSALLSPEGRARLDRVGARLGVSPAAIDRLRPWFADVTIGVVALMSQGASVTTGVERTLADAAPGARRRAFETPAEQIAFFADAPLADQLASLEDTLKQIDEDPAYYDRLIDAWVDGDTRAIEDLGLTPMKQVSLYLYDRLIVQRNRRWAETIAERLAGAGETVIVVGVGHLVGPDSVPALLRARGFKVEGP